MDNNASVQRLSRVFFSIAAAFLVVGLLLVVLPGPGLFVLGLSGSFGLVGCVLLFVESAGSKSK